jgi:hypothetical protein
VIDRGHAAVELALAVAVLMLPVALAVTAFGPWSERRVLADAAAAEAARAVVLALDHRAGSEVIASMVQGHGLGLDQVRASWCDEEMGPLADLSGGCPLTRGSVVTATVQVWVPMVHTPWGDVGGLWATGVHVEPIDLYRSIP